MAAAISSGPPPYGYRMEIRRELVPIPAEQHVLWLIAHLRRKGWPMQKIADQLTAYGLTTRQGLPFSKQAIHLILQRLPAEEDLAETGDRINGRAGG